VGKGLDTQDICSPLQRASSSSRQHLGRSGNMDNTLFLPELRKMLADNNALELREFCTALHPARTAEFMEGLEAADAWRVLRHADLKLREEIFGYFPREKQVELLESQDRAEVAELLADLPADDRVDLLHDVRPEVVEEL